MQEKRLSSLSSNEDLGNQATDQKQSQSSLHSPPSLPILGGAETKSPSQLGDGDLESEDNAFATQSPPELGDLGGECNIFATVQTTHQEPIDWDADVAVDDEEVYESLMRAIARTEGFGLFFVRCIEKDRAKLEQRIKKSLPKLRFNRLKLKKELKDGNLYRRVAEVSQQLGPLNGLFISGLEKSLDPYVKSGYGGLGDYYNKDTIPRVLGHLNLQRERFRDDFSFCLIFFLSAFGIKYIARRAPDFFDWRSGLFEFVVDEAKLGKLTQKLQGAYTEYLTWTETQRLDRIREIQALIDEDRQTSFGKSSLFFEKANILLVNQSYEEAINSFDKALKFKPDKHEIWHNRGFALDELNRYEEAIASYDKAVEFKPDKHESWDSRGIALRKLNRYEEAISSYDKALKFKSNDHGTWYNRGVALSSLNRHEEAVTSYDKAIEFKSNHYEAWYNHGVALGNLNRYEEAIASYDKVIAFKPDDYEAWYNRGNVLYDLNRYEEAINSYEQALKFKSDDHGVWYNYGLALSYLNRHKEAIASYDKVIAFKPDDYKAWYNRGNVLYDLNRYEEAIASYNKVIELQPDDYEAWYGRGISLGSLNRHEEAIQSFNVVIELQPDNYDAWFNRGFALVNLHRYTEAISAYDNAIDLKPDYQIAWFNRACALALINKIDFAFADLSEAIRLNPEEYQKLAVTDPDLELLREDPRFEKLLGLATTTT